MTRPQVGYTGPQKLAPDEGPTLADVDLDATPVEGAEHAVVENPDWDSGDPDAEPRWVRGTVASGGNGGEALRGEGQIDDPDTDTVVSHGLPRAPEPGEIQVQPRNTNHDVVRHAVHSETASAFTVEVEPAPGSAQSFEFGWLWVPADLTAPSSYVEEVAADNPFAWWRFEETADTNVADEQEGHDGTTVNSPDLDVDGRVGSGIEGDGTNQYVNVGQLGAFGSSMDDGWTIEFWARWTTGGIMRVGGVYNDGSTTVVDLAVNNAVPENLSNGRVSVWTRTESGNSRSRESARTDLNDGEWHHIVFVDTGTTVNCYIDGVLDNGTGATAGAGSYANFGYGFTLLARNVRGTIGAFMDGRCDEFALYDHALSADRVAAHFAAADVPEGS